MLSSSPKPHPTGEIMVAMGLWGVCLIPNQHFAGRLDQAVLITNVALTDQLQDPEGRTSVKITMPNGNEGKSTFVLCSLTPGKIEQCTVNITLHSGVLYTLQAVGTNSVYVTGNFVDQFAIIRHLGDILRPPARGASGAELGDDQSVVEPILPMPSVTVDPAHPQSDPENDMQPRRIGNGGRDTPTAEGAPKPLTKGKGVERATPQGERIQWADYAPGQGERTIRFGDEVLLKYKMIMSTNGVLISDNIQGKPLRLVVGDTTARVPLAVHPALVGMKLKAQRIVKVPLEAAQQDTGLSVFLKPAQAYRIDIFVVDIIPARSAEPSG